MKKNLVLVYLLWVILYFGLLLIFNLISGSATVGILALAFGLVFFMFPGWLLNRFLKIEFKEIVGQSLVNFVLSLGFYLLINLTAIVIGLSIFQLLITNIILLIILFGAAFIYDYSTQKEYHLDFKFEKISVIYLLPIMVSILIIVFIDSQGANFNGDPYYHLAIVRKAFDGLSLTVSNLSYSHSAPNNPAYILPAWHLVIATYAKLTKIDIFAAWSKVNLTLLVWALLSLYFFVKNIFTNRLMIIVCFLVSLFFLFYAGPGYFFQRLAVPDTLAQFILLPSVLAFSLIYIFTKNKKILWLLGALMIALADVHAIHYLYYIFILLFFAISLSLANLFKGKDTLKPAWMLLGVNILVLILVGVILELKSGFTSSNLTSFLSAPISEIAYPTFKFFQITFKIGLALLPLTLIFAKNRQSLIIAASFLLAPIIYWTPLKDLTIRLFSYIFTDRLLGNVGWYYLVIGAVLGGIFIVIENLFKNPQSKKILGFTSVFFVMVMAILEATRQTFSNLIYYIFFSTPTLEQTYTWAGPLFVISLVLAIVFLVWQKFSQKDVFSISKSENLPYIVAASLVIILFFYPTIFRQAPINWSFMVFSRNGVNSVGTSSLGLNFDGNLMEFIKTDIPSKSTILANAPTSKNLSVLTDNYMVYNQGTAWAEKFKKVFGGEFDSSVVKEIINDPKYKIDYIIVSPVDQINSDIFNESRYKLIYNQEVSIYQANK